MKEIQKFLDIPKHLHPESEPDHAAQLGVLAGILKTYAQNGYVWDLVWVGGEKQQVNQIDLALVICNKILKINEKETKKNAVLESAADEISSTVEEVGKVMEVVVDDEAEAVIAEEVAEIVEAGEESLPEEETEG